MNTSEGLILKNKLKGTGKTMASIAAILEMTRQNLSYHLRKEVLEPDFKRLLEEKSKSIFHVEHSGKKEGIYINDLTQLLNILELSQKNLTVAHDNLRYEQETIRRFAEKLPDKIEPVKNGLPSSKTNQTAK